MNVETAAEQLFFSTVRLEHAGGVGTSFIVQHAWAEDKQGLFLVTNKHVIAGATKARFFFTLAEGTNAKIGDIVEIALDEFEQGWTGHPDDAVDVAAAPLVPLLNQLDKEGRQPFIKAIPTTIVPTVEQASKELDAIEEVFFIGYPIGIYDTVNLLPVARRGTTATPFSLDYCGKPAFLIDASVFPGSSGSPVLIFNKGSYSPREGGVVVASRVLLLGIVASVLVHEQDGKLDFIDVPTTLTPRVRTPELADLGIVFKSRTIVETIEALLHKYGEL